MPTKDISGSKYWHLSALHRVASTGNRAARYLFRCDCGNERELEARNVTSGRIRTCGKCQYYSKIRRRTQGQNGTYMAMFRRAIARSAKQGKDWAISPDKYLELVQENCHLCGTRPGLVNVRKGITANYLNLVRQTSHYTQDNVYTACKECNQLFSKVSISLVLKKIPQIWRNSFHLETPNTTDLELTDLLESDDIPTTSP